MNISLKQNSHMGNFYPPLDTWVSKLEWQAT